MDKRTSLKIASIALLAHGLMEILGALILPYTPSKFLPTGLREGNIIFWAAKSLALAASSLLLALCISAFTLNSVPEDLKRGGWRALELEVVVPGAGFEPATSRSLIGVFSF